MPTTHTIDPEDFVKTVTPLLERNDLQGLIRTIHRRWTAADVMGLVACRCDDARKVAILSLAWVGGRECIPLLVGQLRDDDEMVHQMAEHALWSVWFRAGKDAANHELCRGSRATDRRDYSAAMTHLDKAVELDANFAEPYNQRAIVHYLCERYEQSLADCDRAVALMPCHFGAWAGRGHALLQTGRLAEAAESYARAVEIHPHMCDVRETLAELRRTLGGE